jgi:hypothetical protein
MSNGCSGVQVARDSKLWEIGPIRGLPAQKAKTMSVQPQEDGHAMTRVRCRIRTLLLAPALAMAALSVGAGVGSASAASPASPVLAGVTWHNLALINGWQSAGGSPPSWAVKAGVVYLSGAVQEATSLTNDVFAVLPTAARPAHALWVTVQGNFTSTVATVSIAPDGELQAYSSPSTTAQFYTSLAAVSFPAAATASRKLTLRHGWKSSQGAWHSGDPSYHVSGGVVYLSGSLHQASGSNTEFAVLPRAARPASIMYLTVYTYKGTTGVLRIYRDGEASAYGGLARSFTSLAGVSYPAADSPRHKLALVNGWRSAQGPDRTGDPSYQVSGGVVYLAGSLYQPGAGSSAFARLPAGARPVNNLYIKVYTFGGTLGTLVISTTGEMKVFSSTPRSSRDFTSLAGISYALGS